MQVCETEFKSTPRFTIEHRLGAGGMGVVYRVYDRDRETSVALKTLLRFDAQALYRFKNEFRALADIRHPNLIGLGELICDDGQWFFTMDLVDGQDFLAFVRRDQEPEARAAEARGAEAGAAAPRAAEPGAADPRAPEATPSSDTIQAPSDTAKVAAASSADDTVDAPPLAAALVRPPKFDEARLRAALAELALGVSALHAAGKVHRDIKPSNVMVTRTGKVVVLDFGLITDLLAGRESLSGQIVGTPAYMAPEQAAGAAVGPAADWYSVGMVLYEALTGVLPFRGTIFEIILAKQRAEPPPPRAVASGVPADLDALCRELLRIDPKMRPEGKDILERLGTGTGGDGCTSTRVGETSDAMRRASTFVGRERELAALLEAFAASRRGAPVTVFVHGESGLGKSELVRHFVEGLETGAGEPVGASPGGSRVSDPRASDPRASDPRPLILAGRCYERESVPYKAFDGIVDALSRYLCRIDLVDAALLLPRDATLLAQVFPVLRRVSAIERLPASRLEGMDPISIRTRAFLALRELLAKLVERRPLVLGIDDFQWADADSQALLREVLRPPEAPALLLLSTTRSEGQPELDGDVRRIDLKPLSPEETHALVHLLSGSSATDPAAIAREAGGHPLFIQELVRHAPVAGQHAPARLDDVLWARVGRLDAEARGLLEVVAVAGAPIAQDAVARAAGLDAAASARCVSVLRAENLVRTSGTRGQDAVESYHDRVRESVLAHLDDGTRRGRHRGIADALEGSGSVAVDPNALLRHLEACGETARAAKQAEQAARLAVDGLAFERAAELYGAALRLGEHAPERRRDLRMRLAGALASAERGPEAAKAYLQAAEGADAAAAFDCRRRAAEHLLGSGHLEEGIEQMNLVLAEYGDRVPRTQRRALLSFLWLRFRIWLRGLRWSPREEREISAADLVRIDVYQANATTFVILDPIQAYYFQSRALLLTLRAGEKRRLADTLAHEAAFVTMYGARSQPRALELLTEAQRIAKECGDRATEALVTAYAGVVHYQGGRFASARECLEKAERGLLASGTAQFSVWLLHTFSLFRLWANMLSGRYLETRRLRDEMLRHAVRRGDRAAEVTVARGTFEVFLAADEPARGRVDLESRDWPMPLEGYQLPHFFSLFGRVEADLYERRIARLQSYRSEFDRCVRSTQGYNCMLRAAVSGMHGRLALLDASASPTPAPLAREAARTATKLEKEHLPYADVWATLLRAGIAFQSHDLPATQRLLRDAIPLAERHDMLSCAAAARRRLGALLGGPEGAALISQADAWYASEGVKSPERMTDMLAPGFRRPATPALKA